ncbi:hypothetical protein AYO20_05717 [Fonsecaea nubica]|uniref:Uncharacterized protein n=1 Tax=Fonsecaea nubica TaxID=856822 RepID=A0A178D0I8_9EURO|nr:hypothetical protein AYO20_05717 [Fonsecaea nubica]OAL35002.1 hypothetical protein AYO20_05717 [Fonsecaea nubica]
MPKTNARTTMLSSFTTLLLFLSYTTLSTGYPSPSDVKYLAKGQCSYAGQIVCASESTFAICDASLTGVVQPLAVGDTRCGAFGSGGGGGGKNTPPPPASSSTTTAAAALDTLAFMKTVASMMATALHPSSKLTPTPKTTPPPSKPSPKPSSSTTTKKPSKETTSKAQPAKSSSSSSKSNPHFASGTGLQVIPITIRGATPTAGGS